MHNITIIWLTNKFLFIMIIYFKISGCINIVSLIRPNLGKFPIGEIQAQTIR